MLLISCRQSFAYFTAGYGLNITSLKFKGSTCFLIISFLESSIKLCFKTGCCFLNYHLTQMLPGGKCSFTVSHQVLDINQVCVWYKTWKKVLVYYFNIASTAKRSVIVNKIKKYSIFSYPHTLRKLESLRFFLKGRVDLGMLFWKLEPLCIQWILKETIFLISHTV